MPYICARSHISGAMAHTLCVAPHDQDVQLLPLGAEASHQVRSHSWRRKGCAIAGAFDRIVPLRFEAPGTPPYRRLKSTRDTSTESRGWAFRCLSREEIEVQRFGGAHHLLDRETILDGSCERASPSRRASTRIAQADSRSPRPAPASRQARRAGPSPRRRSLPVCRPRAWPPSERPPPSIRAARSTTPRSATA